MCFLLFFKSFQNYVLLYNNVQIHMLSWYLLLRQLTPLSLCQVRRSLCLAVLPFLRLPFKNLRSIHLYRRTAAVSRANVIPRSIMFVVVCAVISFVFYFESPMCLALQALWCSQALYRIGTKPAYHHTNAAGNWLVSVASNDITRHQNGLLSLRYFKFKCSTLAVLAEFLITNSRINKIISVCGIIHYKLRNKTINSYSVKFCHSLMYYSDCRLQTSSDLYNFSALQSSEIKTLKAAKVYEGSVINRKVYCTPSDLKLKRSVPHIKLV